MAFVVKHKLPIVERLVYECIGLGPCVLLNICFNIGHRVPVPDRKMVVQSEVCKT